MNFEESNSVYVEFGTRFHIKPITVYVVSQLNGITSYAETLTYAQAREEALGENADSRTRFICVSMENLDDTYFGAYATVEVATEKTEFHFLTKYGSHIIWKFESIEEALELTPEIGKPPSADYFDLIPIMKETVKKLRNSL